MYFAPDESRHVSQAVQRNGVRLRSYLEVLYWRRTLAILIRCNLPATHTEIQLRVDGSLCEVDPDDVISDLVGNDGQASVKH